ncbi:hypothetical protein ACFQ08_08455 [Streptosporangium algeriense]|uniref:Uncharacterized protein n=1 Tax=Streptosporangium algeriense TaxID=1682748 RepID=A0ABW3DL32_9ACTN
MRILGFYEELWPARAEGSLGTIRDFVRDIPEPDEENVIRYLVGGHELFSVMGVNKDVLGSDYEILAGDSIMSDGEWVWRKGLWFYLSRYHVELPEDFLEKVRSCGYEVPSVPDPLLDELADGVSGIW